MSAPVATAGQRAVTTLETIVANKPGGQARSQQQQMAVAVADAVASTRPLLVQAGTGAGKSLGYLAGAVAAAPEQLVIATATNQLLRQLATWDAPTALDAAHQAHGTDLTFAVIKGRANYLCLAKLSETLAGPSDGDAPPELDLGPSLATPRTGGRGYMSAAEVDAFQGLLTWAQSTTTGDRDDAPAISEHLWRQVAVDNSGCPGAAHCPLSKGCHSERARETARQADIIITNHALIANDMASDHPILGHAWDAVIVDEAHEFHSAMANAWGHHVDPARITTAAHHARKLARTAAISRDHVTDTMDALTDAVKSLPVGELLTIPGYVASTLDTAMNQLVLLAEACRGAAANSTGLRAAQQLGAAGDCAEHAEALYAIASADPEQFARWVSDEPHRIHTAPLNPGPLLQTALAGRPLIATSATLTPGGSFEHAAGVFGLDPDHTGWDCVDVGTPFDYARQAKLYVPDPAHFPTPVGRERAEHTAAVLEELCDLVTAAGGATLALFTTTKAAVSAAEHLRRQLPHLRVLAHGEGPASSLAQQFIDDPDSVLCATMGMWHGLDAAGDTCQLVVIDKLPFAPADDPLLAARRRVRDSNGSNGWAEVFLSEAATTLAQGVGRLIRTTTDRGVVALLDPRVRSKGYGRYLLSSLPPMQTVGDKEFVLRSLQVLRQDRHGHPVTS